MNEQLESLIYYIKWLRSQGIAREELVNQQDRIGFVVGLLEQAPATTLYRARNWHGAGEPLPLVEIDFATNFETALDAAFAEQGTGAQGQKEGNLFERYVRKECRTDEESQSLTSDVDSFWERLNTYMKPQNPRAYGLAVGRVQSGKTRNYIGLMLKAIDNGFNLIIILTSKNSSLAVQTQKRVKKWVRGGDKPDEGLEVPNCVMLSELTLNAEGAEVGVRWNNTNFSPNDIHVGVIIKNEKGHLENVKEWMSNVKARGLIKQVKLLFIDDESDSATPNTNNIGPSEIQCEGDIKQKIDILRYRQDITGNMQVAEWLEKLLSCVETIPENDFATMQGKMKGVKGRFLKSCIREDDEFKRISGLNERIEVDGQNWDLYDLVYQAFDHKASKRSKRQPLNARVLQDCFNFLFNVKQERSRINNSICAIAGATNDGEPVFDYGKLIYVGYTATPFANLLQEDYQENQLCPDCIKPLTTSSKYFGLERIFGGTANKCNMNIVRTISEDEKRGWITPLQERDDKQERDDEDNNEVPKCTEKPDFLYADLKRTQDFAEEGQPSDVREIEWISLKRAVKWAFCTAAARRAARLAGGGKDSDRSKESGENRWTTMLFNISHLSNQEDGVHRIQQELLRGYINDQLKNENREHFVESCLKVWADETMLEHGFTVDDFNRSCPGYGEPVSYPDIGAIRTNLRWFVDNGGKCQVVQMNSAANGVIQGSYYKYDEIAGDVLWFVCGGNAISRGLTLAGLTVSYFDRIKASSAVDTITQMGRWFGYRKGYELLPRIWMTSETIEEMKEICRTEESLHQELQELYDSEDKTSIRDGRDVVSIMYFGRRLSGRDANGIVFKGEASKGIFTTVLDQPTVGFDITKEFVGQLGAVVPVPPNCKREFHGRHELFWKGVPKEDVLAYIRQMQARYFAGVSKYEAEALLREIDNSLSNWNVVIGNPDVHNNIRTVGPDGGCFAHYLRRNNPWQRMGDEVQLGTGQWTSLAFLARVPDSIVTASHDGLPPMNDGDIRHVAAAYRLITQGDQVLWPLANPTLLIDFVNGPNDNAFVQVSFYWYGHDEASYCKAKISPVKEVGYVPETIKLLDEIGYAGIKPLARMLSERIGTAVEHDALAEQLDIECKAPHSLLKKVRSDEAHKAVLQDTVYYSTRWLENNRVPIIMSDAEQIGLSLYWQIKKNGWFWNEKKTLPNFIKLKEAGRDEIINGEWCGKNKFDYFGKEYCEYYKKLENGLHCDDTLATWWNELPDDDYRRRCHNAFVKSTNALHEFESLPEQVQRQIEAISKVFGIEPCGRRSRPNINGALGKITRGEKPREFGEFVVVALLRKLIGKVNDSIDYCQRRLCKCRGLDDDTRRKTYHRIITKDDTYKEALKHLALCKVFLQRYRNGITGDVDSANLKRANLSDTIWNWLLEEDAAIKANNGQVKNQAEKACDELEKTLASFNC